MNAQIGIVTAKVCNETDREVVLGDFVVINQASRQVLAVEHDRESAFVRAASLVDEYDMDLDVCEVV